MKTIVCSSSFLFDSVFVDLCENTNCIKAFIEIVKYYYWGYLLIQFGRTMVNEIIKLSLSRSLGNLEQLEDRLLSSLNNFL